MEPQLHLQGKVRSSHLVTLSYARKQRRPQDKVTLFSHGQRRMICVLLAQQVTR